MNGFPDISLRGDEITDIQKSINGSFIIRGMYSRDVIYVSGQIENVERLEALLQGIRPITIYSNERQAKQRTIIYLVVTVICLVVTFIPTVNKYVCLLTGSVAVLSLLGTLIFIQRSRQYESGTKRRSWYLLLIILALISAIVARMPI